MFFKKETEAVCNCTRTWPLGHHWEGCPFFNRCTMMTVEQVKRAGNDPSYTPFMPLNTDSMTKHEEKELLKSADFAYKAETKPTGRDYKKLVGLLKELVGQKNMRIQRLEEVFELQAELLVKYRAQGRPENKNSRCPECGQIAFTSSLGDYECIGCSLIW